MEKNILISCVIIVNKCTDFKSSNTIPSAIIRNFRYYLNCLTKVALSAMIKRLPQLIIILLALATAACTNGISSNKENGKSQHIDIAIQNLKKLKVPNTYDCPSDFLIGQQIYETLFTFDKFSLEVKPNLISKVIISKDNRTYTFTLRRGILFSDKSELKVEHIISSLQKMLETTNSRKRVLLKPYIAKASDIRSTGKFQFTIHLNRPIAHFEEILTHPSLAIYHPKTLLGTGPYLLKENKEAEILLASNKNYRHQEKISLKEILFYKVNHELEEIEEFKLSRSAMILNFNPDNSKYVLGSITNAKEGQIIKHHLETSYSNEFNYMLLHSSNSEARKNIRETLKAQFLKEFDSLPLRGQQGTISMDYVVKNKLRPSEKEQIYANINALKHHKNMHLKELEKPTSPDNFLEIDKWNTNLQSIYLNYYYFLKMHDEFLSTVQKETLEKSLNTKSYRQRVKIVEGLMQELEADSYLLRFYEGKNITIYNSKIKNFTIRHLNYYDFMNMFSL